MVFVLLFSIKRYELDICSFAGIIDTDSQQVFDCSSLENTDTENEDSDLDDPMDLELEVEPNEREIVAPNSEHTVGVVKALKPTNQKCLSENGIDSVYFLDSVTSIYVIRLSY